MPLCFPTHANCASLLFQHSLASPTFAVRQARIVTGGALPVGPEVFRCPRTRLPPWVYKLGLGRHTEPL